MPKLTPTKLFLKDLEAFQKNAQLRRKIAKTLSFLQENPLHPGLHIERIVNDPSAWSVRVDRRYRISLEPERCHESGAPE
ncbi:MAG: hypothetical protein HGA78_07075 [Nitrospirales bacterium]|nr:hypothetical protein [Nitrospirales bacterium]